MATPPKDPEKLQKELIAEQKKTTQTLQKLTATVDGEALDTLKEQLAEEQRIAEEQAKREKERLEELAKQTKLAEEQKKQQETFADQQERQFGAEDAYRKVEKEIYEAEKNLNQLLYEAQQAGDENSIELYKQNLQQLAAQKNYFNRQNRDNIEASKRRLETLKSINEGVKQRSESVKERRERYKTEKEDAEKRTEQIFEDFVNRPDGLRDITDSIKLQTETAELSVPMIEKQFKELTFLRMDMAGDKGVAALYDVFTEAQLEFQQGNIGQEELNKIMKEVSEGINDREKQREAERAAELQNMALTQIGQSINKVGSSLGDFAGKAVKTGGLLAGLAGLVLGVIDPELLMKIITDLTTGFLDLVQGFMAFFQGDFETFQTKIKDNLGLFIGIMGGILFYFAGPLLTTLGGLFTGMAKLVRAMKVFRGFMIFKFGAGMMSAFTTMMGILGPILLTLGPILLIGVTIAAAFMLLKEHLGEGASIMDTMKYGALMLIDALSAILNGLTFIPRKIFEFLGGGRLARWIFGDEVGDMVDNFLGEGFKTNRSAEFKENLQARENKKKRDANLVREAELEGVFDDELAAAGVGSTTGDDIEALQNRQFDLKMAQTSRVGTTNIGGSSAISNQSSTNNITTIQYSQPTPSSQMIEATAGR